ncbi:MAG: hypothetical protein OXC29_21480, partial [Rhodococcus sp.]|nr:hypothetical protein [Rhodococcus sp. (in: high G+C Gram-positive bacteria)]
MIANVLQPSFKLAGKTREGARVRTRDQASGNPVCEAARVGCDPRSGEGLSRCAPGMLDPLGLLDEIRKGQHHLVTLAAGATVQPTPQRDAEPDVAPGHSG